MTTFVIAILALAGLVGLAIDYYLLAGRIVKIEKWINQHDYQQNMQSLMPMQGTSQIIEAMKRRLP